MKYIHVQHLLYIIHYYNILSQLSIMVTAMRPLGVGEEGRGGEGRGGERRGGEPKEFKTLHFFHGVMKMKILIRIHVS